MATTGESAPTRQGLMRTTSILIALTSTRRTATPVVGTALRSDTKLEKLFLIEKK